MFLELYLNHFWNWLQNVLTVRTKKKYSEQFFYFGKFSHNVWNQQVNLLGVRTVNVFGCLGTSDSFKLGRDAPPPSHP